MPNQALLGHIDEKVKNGQQLKMNVVKMSDIHIITSFHLHGVKILPMQTPTPSTGGSGSHSWRIKFMGFEIKTFAKASKHYARKSLEQFPGMFPQQCLICICILALLAFERHV